MIVVTVINVITAAAAAAAVVVMMMVVVVMQQQQSLFKHLNEKRLKTATIIIRKKFNGNMHNSSNIHITALSPANTIIDDEKNTTMMIN